MNYSLPFFVTNYRTLMRDHPEHFCKEQFDLMDHIVLPAFESGEIYVDEELARKYFGLSKYLGFERLYEWEEFVLGLHLCTFYKDTGMPRWDVLFCLIGRGAGKDGVISVESMALASPYNPIREYDVDICANNEDQATRPVKDLITAFENNKAKLRRFYKWTQEKIVGLKNNTTIKGHTNNAKGKDGLRSGIVIFNEYHAYENYANINVFTTGLGKKQHPRRSIFTTNGDVVDGPLDELIKDAEEILAGEIEDNGMLPFICQLGSKDEVHDETNWHKANPSLIYKPDLMREIRKEYVEWKNNPARLPAFMTKRMNIRETANEMPVTSWENLDATNKRYEGKLAGMPCIIGIDFSKTTDWAAVNVHFKDGDNRIDINHAWMCMQNPDVARMRCPYEDWTQKGYMDLVYDVEISPEVIVGYVDEMAHRYRVQCICIDSFRFTLLREYLERIGFSYARKNIYLVRPGDIMRTYPIIDRCFTNQYFYWDDQPVLRWATNNTKLVRAKKSSMAKDGELDIGNYLFGKIEPHTRKTDPFMALVHSMTKEDMLPTYTRRTSTAKRQRVRIY